jgi:hypothetical protein
VSIESWSDDLVLAARDHCVHQAIAASIFQISRREPLCDQETAVVLLVKFTGTSSAPRYGKPRPLLLASRDRHFCSHAWVAGVADMSSLAGMAQLKTDATLRSAIVKLLPSR